MSPQEAYIREQRQEWVRQAVAGLPPQYRGLVQLRYFEELSYEEVATRQHLPLGSVKAYTPPGYGLLAPEGRRVWGGAGRAVASRRGASSSRVQYVQRLPKGLWTG